MERSAVRRDAAVVQFQLLLHPPDGECRFERKSCTEAEVLQTLDQVGSTQTVHDLAQVLRSNTVLRRDHAGDHRVALVEPGERARLEARRSAFTDALEHLLDRVHRVFVAAPERHALGVEVHDRHRRTRQLLLRDEPWMNPLVEGIRVHLQPLVVREQTGEVRI